MCNELVIIRPKQNIEVRKTMMVLSSLEMEGEYKTLKNNVRFTQHYCSFIREFRSEIRLSMNEIYHCEIIGNSHSANQNFRQFIV